MPKIEFPKNFLWGTATSGHQVEGNNFNDWSEWEKSEKRIKDLKNPEEYISGRACDHYNLFEQDFDLAKQLNQNAHRFSIEWSRIEPEQGNFNQEEIEHYRRVILSLKQKNIEPFVTLWHWPIPIWLRDKGGWENKEIIEYFVRYAEKVVASFKNDVKFWITINEPMVYSSSSYFKGAWPPNKKNVFKCRKVLVNLFKAHRKAYQMIHQISPQAKVGISKNNVFFEGNILAWLANYSWNKYFLNKIKNYQDFIGLNYYFHKVFKFNQNKNKEVSDMNWEIYPQGIYHLLKDLKKYDKPIYITENGLADARDEKREKFIKDHLFFIHKAIKEGIDVKGYFYWSLLDNFEWDKGFWPRFGLIEIDYSNLERKIRPSAYKYAEICRNNGFDL